MPGFSLPCRDFYLSKWSLCSYWYFALWGTWWGWVLLKEPKLWVFYCLYNSWFKEYKIKSASQWVLGLSISSPLGLIDLGLNSVYFSSVCTVCYFHSRSIQVHLSRDAMGEKYCRHWDSNPQLAYLKSSGAGFRLSLPRIFGHKPLGNNYPQKDFDLT